LESDEIKTLIDGAYILIVNDYELEMILTRTKLTEAEVAEMVEIMITTLGANGSKIVQSGKVVEIPVCPVLDQKDPTGAGDAYRAGLIAGLMAGLDLTQCGRLGSTAAAYAIEQYGTQEHTYTSQEFASRYEQAFAEPCPVVS